MKRNFLFRLSCICLLTFMVMSCKIRRPDEVLPESTMENLLYDYHLAKTLGENLSYTENYKKALYIQVVFSKYGTTEAAFDSSLVWYTRNTEVLSKIYEQVNIRLKAKQNEINHLIAIREKKPMTSVKGDSIDVWAWARSARLTGMPADNQLTFILPADSNFSKRDTLVWEVRYHFLDDQTRTQKPTPFMAMQIVYENDSVIGRMETIARSGVQQIRLQSDTLGVIKEVKGFIYYPSDQLSKTLLVDKISLIRYHSNDSLLQVKDSLEADSVRKILPTEKIDSVKKEIKPLLPRVSPEEMNQRRSVMKTKVKPEQLKIEQHIQQERVDLQKERQLNQRRRQMQQR